MTSSNRNELLRTVAPRGITVCAVLLYAIVLQVVYVWVISPDYSYAGYTTRPLPAYAVFLATFLAVAPSIWQPLAFRRPSNLLTWVLYLVAYVPSVIVPFYALRTPAAEVLSLALALLASFALFSAFQWFPLLKIGRLPINRAFFWIGLVLLTMAAAGVVVWNFGFPRSLPELSAIYEVREEYSEGLAAGGRSVAFAITWLVNVVGPLLMAVGLVRGRWLLLAVGLLLELGIFATTGFKSSLLAPVALVIVHLVLRYGARSFSAVLSFGVGALILLCVLLDALVDRLFLVSWLVRRFLVTPGLSAGRFFEYFSENSFAHLGHSILEGIVRTPYDLTPPYVIGMAYEGRMFSANANIWADGFANFGVVGMLLASLLAGGVIYLFDSLTRQRGSGQKRIVALMLVLPAITFSNSALLTSLMTHGVLIILLVVLAMPRELAPLERNGFRRFLRFAFGNRTGSTAGSGA